MVEDRITDPRRVAQLLASEFTGLDTGPLAELTVVDASPDASPSPGGTEAYDIEYQSRRVGTVSLYPDYVAVSLSTEPVAVPGETALPVEVTEEEIRVRVADGTAVKRAVDLVRSGLAEETA